MALAGFASLDLCTNTTVLPGTGTLEYIPVDDVDASVWNWALLSDDYNLQASIFAGSWLVLPFAPGSAQWSEEQQESEQGDYYRVSVSALLPLDSTTVRGELNAMRSHRYLLRLTRSGIVLLLGTYDMPFRFESRFESGADGGDTRGHRCTFRGDALQKSPGYVPAF